jgi:hypothetical protein
MSFGHETWKGRKKRPIRRIAHDLRLSLPAAGLISCFVLSATAIYAAERLPAIVLFALPTGSAFQAGSTLPTVSAPRAKDPECDVSVLDTTPSREDLSGRKSVK